MEIGDVVGGYRIVGVLGKGGMGRVYRVRNLISDREEAMKVVLPDFEREPEIADRFAREIKVHASMIHPNIAMLHTAIQYGSQILMVMELIDGVGLDDVLQLGPVPLGPALDYMQQVLSALGYAHSHGVVHRDVKPANIIVMPNGTVKLTDFGIARSGGDKSFTQAGMAIGSLHYMSPEQVTASPIDGRSDLYSAGVTLFEMLTGHRPIRGDGDFSLMNAHVRQMPTPITQYMPDIPPVIAAAVMKSLAKDPAARFQTAQEFQIAISSGQNTAVGYSVAQPEAHPLPVDLSKIEARLARIIGPIAKSLVIRAAKQYSSVPDIYRSLAEHIEDTPTRDLFIRACASEISTMNIPVVPVQPTRQTASQFGSGQVTQPTFMARGTQTQTPPGGQSVLDPAMVETAKQKLAVFIGPIAKLVVDRCVKKAQSKQQFLLAIASEIPEERDRKAFISAMSH